MRLYIHPDTTIAEEDFEKIEELCATISKKATTCERPWTQNLPETVHLILTSDQSIQKLNSQFRQKDYPTDVLSFDADAASGEAEIYISIDTAIEQAKSFGHPLHLEVALLFTHGLLHTCGLDHEISANEAAKMRAEETLLLNEAKIEGLEPITVGE